MSRFLRWGILGTARINRALITPLRGSSRNQLTTVASRDPEKAQAYAREWKIPTAYGSYEALLADPEVDVVYISLPNSLHTEWTIRAAQAGKHVLCEKPLALTVSEVDSIAAAAAQSRVVVAEAFMYRHHPQTLRVKEMVAQGEIGRVVMVRGAFTFFLDRPHDVRWIRELGGGSLWDVGCYPVSYARNLLGQEPLEVFGWQALGPSGVDDTFVGQLLFPNDVLVQFSSSFCTPVHTRIEIAGERGSLVVPRPFTPTEKERIILKNDSQEKLITIRSSNLYLGEVEDMAEAVLEGNSPRVLLQDSRANVAALQALYESARTGLPVRLEPRPGPP
jgi:predicted dehydrogenase